MIFTGSGSPGCPDVVSIEKSGSGWHFDPAHRTAALQAGLSETTRARHQRSGGMKDWTEIRTRAAGRRLAGKSVWLTCARAPMSGRLKPGAVKPLGGFDPDWRRSRPCYSPRWSSCGGMTLRYFAGRDPRCYLPTCIQRGLRPRQPDLTGNGGTTMWPKRATISRQPSRCVCSLEGFLMLS